MAWSVVFSYPVVAYAVFLGLGCEHVEAVACLHGRTEDVSLVGWEEEKWGRREGLLCPIPSRRCRQLAEFKYVGLVSSFLRFGFGSLMLRCVLI